MSKRLGVRAEMELATALKAAASLKNFVEGGALEEAISSISLTAALSAVQKAASARDPRAQIWSAVNHLEESEEALRRISEKRALAWSDGIKLEESFRRRVYVLCLEAICYRYLDEEGLSRQALDKAASVERARSARHENLTGRRGVRAAAQLVTGIPAIVVHTGKGLGGEVLMEVTDIAAIKVQLAQTPHNLQLP